MTLLCIYIIFLLAKREFSYSDHKMYWNNEIVYLLWQFYEHIVPLTNVIYHHDDKNPLCGIKLGQLQKVPRIEMIPAFLASGLLKPLHGFWWYKHSFICVCVCECTHVCMLAFVCMSVSVTVTVKLKKEIQPAAPSAMHVF